ncbi:MAG: hypothetical protein PHS82_03285 [Lachnospiraceae bacterium]|nr:hypothetical protein [Lachnospiraceae bacterium]
MGSIVDCFAKEDRVEVKFSDFYNLIKQSAKEELLENAIQCRVPYEFMTTMITGKNDLLAAYEDIGLTPDKIREIDLMYADVCKDVETLRKKNEELQELLAKSATQNDAMGLTADKCPDGLQSCADCEDAPCDLTPAVAEPMGGESQNEKPQKSIDIGKILVLKKAGWKIKDIASEMKMEPQAVSNALYRHRKNMEETK